MNKISLAQLLESEEYKKLSKKELMKVICTGLRFNDYCLIQGKSTKKKAKNLIEYFIATQ